MLAKYVPKDLLNYKEDAAKIAIYEDVLEINAGRLLIELLIILAMIFVCIHICVISVFRE